MKFPNWIEEAKKAAGRDARKLSDGFTDGPAATPAVAPTSQPDPVDAAIAKVKSAVPWNRTEPARLADGFSDGPADAATIAKVKSDAEAAISRATSAVKLDTRTPYMKAADAVTGWANRGGQGLEEVKPWTPQIYTPQVNRDLATYDATRRYRDKPPAEVPITEATLPLLKERGLFDPSTVNQYGVVNAGQPDEFRIRMFRPDGKLQEPGEIGRLKQKPDADFRKMVEEYHPELNGPDAKSPDMWSGGPKITDELSTQDLDGWERVALQYNPVAALYGAGLSAAGVDFDPNREMPGGMAAFGKKVTELPGAIATGYSLLHEADLEDVGKALGMDKMGAAFDSEIGSKADDGWLGEGIMALPREVWGLATAIPSGIGELFSSRSAEDLVRKTGDMGGHMVGSFAQTFADPRRSFQEGPITMAINMGLAGLTKFPGQSRAAARDAAFKLVAERNAFVAKTTRSIDDLERVIKKAKDYDILSMNPKSGMKPVDIGGKPVATPVAHLEAMAKQAKADLVTGGQAYLEAIAEASRARLGNIVGIANFIMNPILLPGEAAGIITMRAFAKPGKAEAAYWQLPLEMRLDHARRSYFREVATASSSEQVALYSALEVIRKENPKAVPTIEAFLRMEDPRIFDVGNPSKSLVTFDPSVTEGGLRGKWVTTEAFESAAPELKATVQAQMDIANQLGRSLADRAVRLTEEAVELGMFYAPEALQALYAPDLYRSKKLRERAESDLGQVAEGARNPSLSDFDGSGLRTNKRREAARQWAEKHPDKPASENPYGQARYEREFGLRTDINGWMEGLARFRHDVEWHKMWRRLAREPEVSLSAEQWALLEGTELAKTYMFVSDASISGLASEQTAYINKINKQLAEREYAARAKVDAAREQARSAQTVLNEEAKRAQAGNPTPSDALGAIEAVARETGLSTETVAKMTAEQRTAIQRNIEAVRQQKAVAEQKAAAIRDDIAAKTKAAKESVPAELTADIASLTDRSKKLGRQIQGEERTAKRMRDATAAEIAALESGQPPARQFAEQRSKIGELETRANELRREIQIDLDAIVRMQGRRGQELADGQIAAAEQRIAARRGQLDATKAEIDAAKRSLSEVEQAEATAVSKRRTEIDAKAAKDTQAKELDTGRIGLLRKELATVQQQIRDLRAREKSLQYDPNAEARAAVERDATAKRAERDAVLGEIRGLIEQRKALGDSNKARASELDKDIRVKRNRASKLAERAKALDARAQSLRARNETPELRRLRNEIKALDKRAKTLRGQDAFARDMERAYQIGEARKSLDDARAMIDEYSPKVDAAAAARADLRAVRTPKVYGEMAGRYMREDLFVEMANVELAAKAMGSALGTFMRKWKSAKTAWSPTATGRNILTNMLLFAPMAGSSLFNPVNWPAYYQTIKDLTVPLGRRSAEWKQGYQDGMLRGSLYREELSSGAAELAPMRGLIKTVTDVGTVLPKALFDFAVSGGATLLGKGRAGVTNRAWRRIVDTTTDNIGRFYSVMDDVFRTAYYFIHKDKLGSKAAAENASRLFIDYSAASGFINVLKQPFAPFSRNSTTKIGGAPVAKGADVAFWLIGQPFIAFTARSIPLFQEWMARQPHVASAYLAMYDTLSDYAAAAAGIDKENEDAKVEALPFYARGRSVNMSTLPESLQGTLLDAAPPRETSAGEERPDQYLNAMWLSMLDYLTPQSKPFSTPFGDVMNFANQKVVGTGMPLVTAVKDLASGYDSYSGRQIYPQHSGVTVPEQVVAAVDYLGQKLLPPIMPSLVDITDSLGLTNRQEVAVDTNAMRYEPTPAGPQVQRTKAGPFWEDVDAAQNGRPNFRGDVVREPVARLGQVGIKATEAAPTETVVRYVTGKDGFLDTFEQAKRQAAATMRRQTAEVMADPEVYQAHRENVAKRMVRPARELRGGLVPYVNDSLYAQALVSLTDEYLGSATSGDWLQAAAALDNLLRVAREQKSLEGQMPRRRFIEMQTGAQE